MKKINVLMIAEMYGIATVGGIIFHLFSIPLAWILGPITSIVLWKLWAKRTLQCPKALRSVGFIILGIYFGLFFTASTFETVLPYIIPYTISTCIIVGTSIINSAILSKFIKIDLTTSVFGSIPGGLSQMVAVSEDLRANVAMVTILQTVRLLTVVFIVPFIVLQMFVETEPLVTSSLVQEGEISSFTYFWFLLAAFAGFITRKVFPAAYVVAPMLVIACLKTISVPLGNLPFITVIWAQITVGMYMGNSISIKELKLGGKYCVIYALLAIWLIVISFGLGYMFSKITDLSIQSAILSMAPGGIVEMVLTATLIGADASIVSSLQLIRVLIIVLVVPLVLKWWFARRTYEIDRT